MIIQGHTHKNINISNDDDNEYYITIYFEDRISYYRYHNDYLGQIFDYVLSDLDDYNCNRKISDYHYIQNIRNFNGNSFNPFYLDKISDRKTIEKLSDYYYVEKEN